MLPPDQVPDSQRLRARAQECRTMAELFHARTTRIHLLEIAAEYDNLSLKAAARELQEADAQHL
jgi:hypothetical protein